MLRKPSGPHIFLVKRCVTWVQFLSWLPDYLGFYFFLSHLCAFWTHTLNSFPQWHRPPTRPHFQPPPPPSPPSNTLHSSPAGSPRVPPSRTAPTWSVWAAPHSGGGLCWPLPRPCPQLVALWLSIPPGGWELVQCHSATLLDSLINSHLPSVGYIFCSFALCWSGPTARC